MEEKVNNITINLTSLVDYIRDKDVLIDGLRFTLDTYKTTIDKIKEISNRVKEEAKEVENEWTYQIMKELDYLLEEII